MSINTIAREDLVRGKEAAQENKEAVRQAINKKVEEFLSSGGKITELEPMQPAVAVKND